MRRAISSCCWAIWLWAQDTRYKNFLDSYSQWTPILSTFSTITGLVSLYLSYRVLEATSK